MHTYIYTHIPCAVSSLEGKLCRVQYPLVVREPMGEPHRFMLNVLFFYLTQGGWLGNT